MNEAFICDAVRSQQCTVAAQAAGVPPRIMGIGVGQGIALVIERG